MLFKTLSDINKNVIIGLTGKTGSGCTTVAEILATKKFGDLKLKPEIKGTCSDVESKKYKIIYNYFNGQDAVDWIPFKTIRLSTIILQIVMEEGLENLITCIKCVEKWNLKIDSADKLIEQLYGLESEFQTAVENRKTLERLLHKSSPETVELEDLKAL